MHDFLKDSIKERVSFVEGEDGEDFNGHGTSVASIIKTVAPDIEIYSAKVLDRHGRGKLGWILSSYNYAIEKRANLMNLSLGSPINCCISTLTIAHFKAISLGVTPVYASGNFGPGKLSCPAMIRGTISVGSVSTDGRVAEFTSCGVGCFGDRKPLVVEYGGSYGECLVTPWSPNSTILSDYQACVRGTSQATPFLTGLLALGIQEYVKDRGATPSYYDIMGWIYASTDAFEGCKGRGVVKGDRLSLAVKTAPSAFIPLSMVAFAEGLKSIMKSPVLRKAVLPFLPVPPIFKWMMWLVT